MTDRRKNSPTMTSPTPRKPWFGSKRIGWGISPQTWQGWTITLSVPAIIIVVGLFVSGQL
jgi:hypothetical protein